MKIAVLGTGGGGRAHAARLAEFGHEDYVGAARRMELYAHMHAAIGLALGLGNHFGVKVIRRRRPLREHKSPGCADQGPHPASRANPQRPPLPFGRHPFTAPVTTQSYGDIEPPPPTENGPSVPRLLLLVPTRDRRANSHVENVSARMGCVL
ncbi:hypothetical protein GCM10010211_45820 [Streptomyces albospinus]|uniref:Uncharacterized protein n=1 Tax=Streptomyces albospinus TaxID=285515 RepID=A0ABQ2V9I0_9ACTN|nr:hypothetical protein [Streptomyces albospinus]GGU74746.1 hypothetical protein GCM10010211_45820 [Streptomyces albospinus]